VRPDIRRPSAELLSLEPDQRLADLGLDLAFRAGTSAVVFPLGWRHHASQHGHLPSLLLNRGELLTEIASSRQISLSSILAIQPGIPPAGNPEEAKTPWAARRPLLIPETVFTHPYPSCCKHHSRAR
jgi:hypothetical protein